MQTAFVLFMSLTSMTILMSVYIFSPFSLCFVSSVFKTKVLESSTEGKVVWFLVLMAFQTYSVILVVQAASTDSGVPMLTAIFVSVGWMKHLR